MTREEFDKELNEDTLTGLAADRAKYTGLVNLARTFKRDDIADILMGALAAVRVAAEQAERLGVPVQELS